MLHAYECVVKFPAIFFELALFPPELFSKDYVALREEIKAQRAILKKLYEEKKGENSLKVLAYYTKQGGRLIAAGSVGAGVAAIVAVFTGGALPSVTFGAVARGVYEKIDVKYPNLVDVESIEHELEQLNTELLRVELYAQAAEGSEDEKAERRKLLNEAAQIHAGLITDPIRSSETGLVAVAGVYATVLVETANVLTIGDLCRAGASPDDRKGLSTALHKFVPSKDG